MAKIYSVIILFVAFIGLIIGGRSIASLCVGNIDPFKISWISVAIAFIVAICIANKNRHKPQDINCPFCDSELELPDDFYKGKVRCSLCGEKFIVTHKKTSLLFKHKIIIICTSVLISLFCYILIVGSSELYSANIKLVTELDKNQSQLNKMYGDLQYYANRENSRRLAEQEKRRERLLTDAELDNLTLQGRVYPGNESFSGNLHNANENIIVKSITIRLTEKRNNKEYDHDYKRDFGQLPLNPLSSRGMSIDNVIILTGRKWDGGEWTYPDFEYCIISATGTTIE
jgi:hypothetical protein